MGNSQPLFRLPAEWEPTTCDGGDCSPLPVSLATDDTVVSGLAFGWALPAPPPEDVCFRGPGFWKHQYSCLVRSHRGHAQLDRDDLMALLETVESETSIDWTRGDGNLDPEDVVFILEQTSGHCAQAHRHWLTALLNWAYNGAHPGLPVDTDRDGEVDSTMGAVITVAEPMLALGQKDACREVKQLATAVNETPSVNCGLRNVGESSTD